MIATLTDVARAAGCSNATVSRVVNNTGPVSAEVRAAVLRAMKRLKYVARPTSAETPPGTTETLEIILHWNAPYERLTLDENDLTIAPPSDYPPEQQLSRDNRLSNSFYRTIVDGIIHEAPQWGFKASVQFCDNLTDPAFLAGLRAPERKGVLLTGLYSTELPNVVRACAHPLVLVDLLIDEPTDVVTFDNLGGVSRAFEHLFELGHRKIGFLAGPLEAAAYQERLTAFRYKMAEKDLPVRPEWLYTGSRDMAPTAAWAAQMLRGERPSAMICANDFMAIALTKAARQAGIAVPEQLSVVGFDDIEPAALVTPALTTVRVPTEAMGRQAVRQLAIQMKLGARRERQLLCTRLAPELIVRESTAPAH